MQVTAVVLIETEERPFRTLTVNSDDPQEVADGLRGFSADVLHVHLKITPQTTPADIARMFEVLPTIRECLSHSNYKPK